MKQRPKRGVSRQGCDVLMWRRSLDASIVGEWSLTENELERTLKASVRDTAASRRCHEDEMCPSDDDGTAAYL